MNGYIKYFDDVGKKMSFVTDDEEVYEKYNEIWEIVRKLLKDKIILLILKIFTKLATIIEIIMKKFTKNNK